jgi:hypothetical protein
MVDVPIKQDKLKKLKKKWKIKRESREKYWLEQKNALKVRKDSGLDHDDEDRQGLVSQTKVHEELKEDDLGPGDSISQRDKKEFEGGHIELSDFDESTSSF